MSTRIIIVEDERIIAEDIRMTVENLGLKVAGVASSGQATLAMLETEDVDIIMMDVHIQGDMDGIETAKLIYEKYNVPIVFLTAYADPTTVERIRQTTAYGFIVKPVSQDSIQGTLELAIDRHQMDIKLKEREEKLAHVNQVLRGIRNVNQLIVKESDIAKLLQGVCDNLIADLGYQATWIALLDEKKKDVLFKQAGYRESLSLCEKLQQFQLPNCITKQKKNESILIIQVPGDECGDCPLIDDYINYSRFIVHFELKSGVVGIMSVVVPQSYAMDADEQELFKELVDDVVYALNKIDLEKVHQDVENQREESRLMLKTILDAIPVRVFWKDLNLNYLGCNAKFARDAGFNSPEELIGKNDSELRWKEQARLYQQMDQEVIHTGKGKKRFEEPQIGIDGRERILRKNKIPLKNVQGDIIGMLGTYEDITYQKDSEKALRESEQRLRNIIDHSNEIYFICDTDYNIQYASSQCLDIMGYTPEELAGQWARLISENPINEHGYNLTMQAFQSKKRQKPHILEVVHKSGKNLFIEVDESPLLDDSGNVIGMVGAIRDITKRKQVEDTLVEREAQFSKAMKVAHIGCWEYDIIEDVFTFTDHLFDIFRTSIKEVGTYQLSSKQFAKQFVHPDDVDKVHNEIERVIKLKNPDINVQFEHRFLYNGQTGYIRVHLFVILDKEGRPIKASGVGLDITDQK